MVGLKVSFKSRGSMKELTMERELTMEKELSIGEMATRAGVKSSTLRYYESIGLLPAAKRTSGQRPVGTGCRLYASRNADTGSWLCAWYTTCGEMAGISKQKTCRA
jgi:MerR family regulatory protein